MINNGQKCSLSRTDKIGKFVRRGKISETLSPGDEINFLWKKNGFTKPYRLSILDQYQDKSPTDNELYILSFTTAKKLLDSSTHSISMCAFIPIFLYPAAKYDIIFSTMISFQDVLKQKEPENGPFWWGEGVCYTAKEIHTSYPQKFSNIFLGIVSFYLEKLIIRSLNRYLKSSSIQNMLVEEKIYGPAVVNSVKSSRNDMRRE